MHGVLIGLIPLGLLAGIVLIAAVATALARELTASGGFYVQQQAQLERRLHSNCACCLRNHT